ncbi:hypothetical protein PYCCODRAFT_1476133 [Trametes coccinea BRFM310]|uniref:Uncharacterized protein n=1 Tax=Trametes coccinea (strain BRFM310) TaxID=1353009 RepID=A0A1Y2IWJ9_TRAC3|nr:hypothetical protein PYCCODRAFT_1476133 [Trametes coccinea BRFM310]
MSRPARTATRTVAIDDTYGDGVTGELPVYSPPANWIQGKPCGQDDVCLMNPDPSIVRNGTWHDSVGISANSPPRTIDLTFEGNSISVFCITSEADTDVIAVSNITFELDGQDAGQFYRDVTGQQDASGTLMIHYNVEVFTMTIPDGNHTLRISSVGRSRMLFYYALYTTHTDLAEASTPFTSASSTDGHTTSLITTANGDTSSTTAHGHLMTIIGAAVAGAAALLALGLLIFVLLRRRPRSRSDYQAVDDENASIPRGYTYGKDDIYATSHIASPSTLAIEMSAHGAATQAYSSTSRARDHPLPSPEGLSSSEPSLPLMQFPSPPSDFSLNQGLPRIVVMGTETRWEGPDNSMARIARQRIAEREAELTRPEREVENPRPIQHDTTAPPDFSINPDAT